MKIQVSLLVGLVTALLSSSDALAQVCNDTDNDNDGWSCNAGDCNDFNASIYPGATEVCNAADDDCNGTIDDRPDFDGDGVTSCQGDCAENDARRFPGNPEICDGADNDCSAGTLDSSISRSCYSGPGGTQGVGLCHAGTELCSAPAGWSGTCTGQVVPSTELCDNQDQDCDGNPLNGIPDADGDGSPVCFDCDDNNPNRRPGLTEVCDGVDNDCNPATPDTGLSRSCYGGPGGTNGVGICHGGTQQCTGSSYGTCNGQQLPQTEICDALDQDCDGNLFNGIADADGDGSPVCLDCDDNDASRRPGLTEVCDGVDNDCNAGTLDTNLSRSCYSGPNGTSGIGICHGGTQQCTGSSFGSCNGQQVPQVELCDAIDQDCNGNGYNGFPNQDNDPVPACAGDCNDLDPQVYPGHPEVCDAKDNDCDGTIDENFDSDGDGWTTCAGDCNDGDFTIYPGAPEACNGRDDDCDGTIDDGFTDADSDGFRNCGPNPDCDDNDAARFPGNPELCDGKDNDCDTLTDERNAQGGLLRQSCYDGPGGTNGIGICHSGQRECIGGRFTGNPCTGQQVPRSAETCDLTDDDCDGATDEGFDQDGDGFATCGPSPDCNDTDAARFPGNAEICDGKDNDCDTSVDEDPQGAALTLACYSGPSGTEGVGVCEGGRQQCMGAGGFGGACVAEVLPAASDACNAADDDCDGETDEGFDLDADGFTSCNGDCDDGERAVHPGALEICNNVDDDCDGTIDGADTACYTGPTGTATVGTCHPGTAVCVAGQPMSCFNEQTPAAEICDQLDNDCDGDTDEDFDVDGDGVASCGGDCDDNSPFVSPFIEERCDCTDNDCDGDIDDDSFGGSVCDFGACHDFDQDGYTNCEGDCDDRSASALPGAPELCGDAIDNDCDGFADENVDEDGDGVTTCDGDCDDRFSAISPLAVEACDAFDNDCDGEIDEGYDEDGDRATICAGDCDDHEFLRSPLRREICGDGIDNDCDGVVDPDDDVDGDGVTPCSGDCNDFNAAVHVGAAEVCDGHDNDCNNQVDEGFDEDADNFATCFGDCDDLNPAIHPFARELIDTVDNNCNSEIDEGQADADGDGFSYLCGDCDDTNPAISPHASDVCDGKDNDCDGKKDRWPWNESSCGTCNDVDNDGVTDCAGDCDDSNAAVNPAVRERCDGVDNDCDGTIDTDRFTVANLCIATDGGPAGDGGGEGMDAATGDANEASDAGTGQALDVDPKVAFACGCSAVEEQGHTTSLFAFVLLFGFGVLMRKRTRVFARAALALIISNGCTRLGLGDLPADYDGGAIEAGAGEQDSGADAGVADRGFADTGTVTYGPLTEGPCRLQDSDRIRIEVLPSREFELAVHEGMSAVPVTGTSALALDDLTNGVFAFAVSLALDPSIDVDDPLASSAVLDDLIDPAFTSAIPGVVGVAQRVDESLKQTFGLNGRAATRSLRRITMANDVLPSNVRDGLLSALTGVPLSALSNVPDVPNEAPTREITVGVLIAVDSYFGRAHLVLALVDANLASEVALQRLTDLSNGTHVDFAGASIAVQCEQKTASGLKVDFLWVVDNSASMQEEQQALADAAETFFASLARTRIDFRLGVVTTDGEAMRGGGFTTDLSEFERRVQVGINGNGREQGLEFALRAVEHASTATAVEQRFRDDAVTVAIFYSDEDSANLRPIEEYTDELAAFGVLPFAIVGPRPRGCLAIGRGAARVGESYLELVEALGGSSASICAEDLTASIQEILIAAAGAASLTRLEASPISGSIEVAIATATVARSRIDGFDYEPAGNSILFFGDGALPDGAIFRVTYQAFQPFTP